MSADFLRRPSREILQIVLVAVLVRDDALEARLVGLVRLPEASDGPAPGNGGFLLAPDAAALGIGEAHAVDALFPDFRGLGGGHTLGFAPHLLLDLFPVQPVHNVEYLVRLSCRHIVPIPGAGLSKDKKDADFFGLVTLKFRHGKLSRTILPLSIPTIFPPRQAEKGRKTPKMTV